MGEINVKGKAVTVSIINDDDYICITDIARYKDEKRTDYIISNWICNLITIEFVGIWEYVTQ